MGGAGHVPLLPMLSRFHYPEWSPCTGAAAEIFP
jgi:hypothetical protein